MLCIAIVTLTLSSVGQQVLGAQGAWICGGAQVCGIHKDE